MDNTLDAPQAESPFARHESYGVQAGGARLNRDSRLDALTRQGHEITKMAAILRDRSFQLVERLDGPRPQTAANRDESVTPSGYINDLQDSFTDIRMALDATNEYLNDLDTLI